MKFTEIPKGLFRYKGIVYCKIDENRAVLITSGEIINFSSEEIVDIY